MSKSLSLERERFRNGISFDNGLFIRTINLGKETFCNYNNFRSRL